MTRHARRGALARLGAALALPWTWPIHAHTGARPDAAQTPSRQGLISIAVVGDVMLADGPGRVIARGRDPFAPFATRLAAADLRIANLECVVARGGQAEDKPWTFRAGPRVLPVLARHIDVVSVANNHSGDFGRAAFGQMLRRLKDQGLLLIFR